MAEESEKTFKLQSVLWAVAALLYVAWAATFIARSSSGTGVLRHFCLFDDAMVSLRYAWNLAHGHGLVWNPGERVEGTTCFLFTLFMTPAAWLLDKSGAALFVQIAGIALVLGVSHLARRISRSLGTPPSLQLITGAVLLTYYPLSYWSLMGMETGALAALALSALVLAMRLGSDPQGSKILGLLLGLMFATRPDAAVPAAVILAFRAAWILVRHRRLDALRPWLVEVAPFAGIVLALTLFRLAYYGSPLPNTYELKMGGWPLLPRLRNGWRFVLPFLDTSRYLLLFAVGSVLIHRDGRRLLLLCFAGSVIACQIWVGGDAWRYWRMLVPATLVLIVLTVDGAGALVRRLLRSERESLAAAFSLACSVAALWSANLPFVKEITMETPAFMVKLNRTMVKAGLELAQYSDPRGSVAVMAAGAVPYYSGLRGVDVLGKSDPHIARLRRYSQVGSVTPGHNKYDLHYSIVTLRPDVIYDALKWARYHPGIFEFVSEHYVRRGSFWFRRDSPHVRWDRLPP